MTRQRNFEVAEAFTSYKVPDRKVSLAHSMGGRSWWGRGDTDRKPTVLECPVQMVSEGIGAAFGTATYVDTAD